MAMRSSPPTTARHSHSCATRPPATTRARLLPLHSTMLHQTMTTTPHAAPGLLRLLPQPTMLLPPPPPPSTLTSTRTTAPPAPRCLPSQMPSARRSYPTPTPPTLSHPISPRSPSASTRPQSHTRHPPRPTPRPAQARMRRRRPWLVQTTLPFLPAPQHSNTTIALHLCETSRQHPPPATQRSAQIP